MSDTEADPEVAPQNGEPEVEVKEDGEVVEEACVEVKVDKKRREHGLLREEQQNVVVQPLLTGKIKIKLKPVWENLDKLEYRVFK